LQKVLTAVGATAVDVALDPLTYLGGKSAGGRGAAGAAAVEAEVARGAARILKPAMLPEVVPAAAPALGKTTLAAKQNLNNRINIIGDRPISKAGLGSNIPSLSKQPLTRPEAIAQATNISAPTNLPNIMKNVETYPGQIKESTVSPLVSTIQPVDPFVNKIAEAAANGYIGESSYGARKAIEKTLRESNQYSPDQVASLTKAILKETSQITRGGLGVKIPFVGRDVNGNIAFGKERTSKEIALLTPGSGYLIDNIGLRGMAESARKVYNSNLRGSAFGIGFGKFLNGQFGEEYAKVVQNYATDGAKGMTYKAYKDFTGVVKDMKDNANYLDEVSIKSLKSVANILEKGTNKDETMSMYKAFYHGGDKIELPLNATKDQAIAFEAATTLRQFVNLTHEGTAEAGARIGVRIPTQLGFVSNHTGRPITQQERAFQKTKGQNLSEYSTAERRRLGIEVDPDGELANIPNTEMNQRFIDKGLRPAGHKVYEEDPLKIAAQEIASNNALSIKYNFIADLKDTNLTVDAKQRTFTLVDVGQLKNKATRSSDLIENKLAALAKVADESGSAKVKKEFDDLIVKVAHNKEVINGILNTVDSMDPNSVKKVGDIFNILSESLESAIKVSDEGTFNPKEIASILSQRGLTYKKQTLKNVAETVDLNLRPIGIDTNIAIPKEISNMFAHESVANAVEKVFKAEMGSQSELKKIFDSVYNPYYTLFKMHATIGRPGGYHVKNLTGAAWNNDLGGVGAGDHLMSAKALNQVRVSNTKAEDAITNLLAGKASGLTGEELTLANTIVKSARARNIPVPETETADLANFILYNKLSKIKVGDHNMADIMTAAGDNNVLRDNIVLASLRSDARLSGGELADRLLDPKYINLYRGVSKDELTTVQKAANKFANFKYLKWSGDAAELSENYVRLAAFINGSRKYGLNDKGVSAGLFVKALQFDYSELSQFERSTLKNIVPFYTWMRRNVPLQFFALMNNPGKFDRLGFAMDELQNQIGSEGNPGEIANVVPTFMRDRMGFVSDIMVGGNPLVVGLETPAMDLNRVLPFGKISGLNNDIVKQIVSAMNPLVKVAMETATGTSTFTSAKFNPVGTPSPFGNIRLPGTNLDAQGNVVVDAALSAAINNLIPPLSNVQKLIPLSDTNQTRYATNIGAMLLGTPFSTADPRQQGGEIQSRISALQSSTNRLINNQQVDKTWLNNLIASGVSDATIKSYIDAGLGKRPAVNG
jgi:hypothetical protein